MHGVKAFLVRLWTAEGVGEPARVLRGVVEPLGRGAATPFRDETELVELLYAELERPVSGDASVGPPLDVS
jgi:hypothetical protein